MSIYRIKKTSCFTTVPNHFVNSDILSAKAKGILLYLLSKPDDWKVYEVDVVNHMRDGRTSIRAGIRELVDAGYITRRRLHGENGRFGGYEYEVREFPISRIPVSGARGLGAGLRAIEEQKFRRGERGNFDDADVFEAEG